MATITFAGNSAEVPDGKRLVLAIEEDLGIDILHRCGGYARCTTCRVSFDGGEPSRMTQAEHERLSERELLGQARLSCQIECAGQMAITPLMTVTTSGIDAGPPPEHHITPPPEWIER
jgi:ferredoxin